MSSGSVLWLFRCDCGKECKSSGSKVRSGHTKSCGCLAIERIRALGLSRRGFGTTHGRSGTSEYRTWCIMKQRCLNPKNKKYSYYGARGIRVCKRWLHSFENFLADMGPRPSKSFWLERINNDGNYAPRNCKWATVSEQMKNRRPIVLSTIERERRANWMRKIQKLRWPPR